MVHLQERGGARRKMDVVLRAYDEGVAFRTVIPIQPATAAAIVRYERTGFYFPRGVQMLGAQYRQVRQQPRGRIRPPSTPPGPASTTSSTFPSSATPASRLFALAEADLLDFAGMYLTGRG
ncbi:MAG: glycoside hydrolase family 97 N-terminal domain-containing protein [Sphingomonas sp.]